MTNILLIDLSSIVHQLFHVTANDPNPDATSIRTVERIRALASGQPHVAVCMDGPPYFRKDIDPTYKAQRDKENNAVIGHQIATAADALRAEGFPVWQVKGFEADDLIATATATAMTWQIVAKDEQGHFNNVDPLHRAVQIASADKDLLQLVSDRVTIKSLRDGSIIDADAVFAKFGVRPDQVRDYLSLVGDTSDNVKGANGIGEKKAAALLGAFGNLEDLYAAIDKGDAAMQPGTLKSLTEFRPRMETVRSLITLRTDAPIAFDEVFKERVPSDVAVFDGGETMGIMDDVSAAAVSEASGVPLETVADALKAPLLFKAPIDPMAAMAGELVNKGAPMAMVPMPPGGIPMLTRVTPDFDLANGPTTYAQAKLMAADLFAAKLFSGYGSSAAVLSTIIIGRELGLTVGAALRGFHIIESKHSMHADLIRARAQNSPACEYFRCTERTNEAATFVTKRKGDPEPVTLRYTIDDARRAWSKRNADGTADEKSFMASGYGKNPADLVVARASSKLARLVYPQEVHGFYAPEELES